MSALVITLMIFGVGLLLAGGIVAGDVAGYRKRLRAIAADLGAELKGFTVEGVSHGQRFQVQWLRSQHAQSSRIQLLFPEPLVGEFWIRRTNAVEDLGRRWALSGVVTTGDVDFDRTMNVTGNCQEFLQTWLAKSRIRELIGDLFRLDVRELIWDEQGLAVRWSVPDAEKTQKLVNALSILRELFVQTGPLPTNINTQVNTSARLAATILWLGICCAALVGCVTFFFAVPLWPLSASKAAINSIGIALLFSTLLALCVRRVLRGHVHAVEHWLGGTFASFLAFWFLAFNSLIIGNVHFDKAKPQKYVSPILAKHNRSVTGKNEYRLTIQDWTNPSVTRDVHVPYSIFNEATAEQSRLVMRIKPGRMGYPWVKKWRVRGDKG